MLVPVAAVGLAACGGAQPCPPSGTTPAAPSAALAASSVNSRAPPIEAGPAARSKFAIVPRPAQIKEGTGAFVIDGATHVSFDAQKAKGAKPVASYLAELLGRSVGAPLAVKPAKEPEGHAVHLSLDASMKDDEAYRLRAPPARIQIPAPNPPRPLSPSQTPHHTTPPAT